MTLVGPDGTVVQGILWTPPADRWRTAVVLIHPPQDPAVHDACSALAAAGLAVLAVAPRAVDQGGAADVATAASHLRDLGAEDVVCLEVPDPAPHAVLVTSHAPGAPSSVTRIEERGGRRRVVAVATAVGLAVGIGLTVATGVLVWPLLGAVAGVGVGDLVAGGRR